MESTKHEVTHWPGNPISYTTTRMTLLFNEQFLSYGTGFIMLYAGQYALVTNWHVVSGRSPIDGKCLSKTGGIPNIVKFHVSLGCLQNINGKIEDTLYFKPIEIKLYGEDDNPIWFDDRHTDNISDYVIILLGDHVPELKNDGCSLRSIKGGIVTLKRGVAASEKVHHEDINHFYPPVGHQVFVVGYPAGIDHTGVFPIWKGGTIASEPTSALTLSGVETDRVIYVDGLTRSGMSGSPVICLQKPGDVYFTDDGVQITVKKPEPLLIGVYAGREGVTTLEADLALGRVWKVSALEELFRRSIIDAGLHSNEDS